MASQPLQLIPVTKDPYNAETPLSTLLNGITPPDLVYIRNHFDVPQIDTAEWSLNVIGSGINPISISYSELRELPEKSITLTLECAGNGRKSMNPVPKGTAWDYGAISIVEFTGTPLHNVLEKAEIPDYIVEVAFHGADQGEVEPGRIEKFIRSLSLEIALNPDTLLAWEMNGQPLTPDHGFPLRLVVPKWYGMASVKWLNKIEFQTEPFKGFFQSEQYVYLDEEGTQQGAPVQHIRPRSLVATPSNGEKLDLKEIVLAGIAWSGYGTIDSVEVSVDGGLTWSEAELEAPTSIYGIQKWHHNWTPEGTGSYTLASKATDSLGNVQPSMQIQNQLGYGNNGPHKIVVSII